MVINAGRFFLEGENSRLTIDVSDVISQLQGALQLVDGELFGIAYFFIYAPMRIFSLTRQFEEAIAIAT